MFTRDKAFIEAQFTGPVPLKPDPMYLAEDVTMYSGAFWVGNELIHASTHPNLVPKMLDSVPIMERLRKIGRLPRMAGTTALVHVPGYRNYFHWLIEALPRLLHVARHRADGGTVDRILLPMNEPAGFIMESIRLFVPELEPLVEFSTKSNFDFERAIFFLDWRMDPKVVTRYKDSTAIFADRLARPSTPPGSRAFLISRGDVDNRRLLNEAALAEALSDWRVEVVNTGRMGVAAQRDLMKEARLIIGVHGAGMTNAIFCSAGTAIVELTSTQYIRRCRSYADPSMYNRMNYGVAVLDQVGDRWVVEANKGNDLEIVPERMGAVRDLVASLIEAQG
jgi:capsular polysaccharide biosynthesis protein